MNKNHQGRIYTYPTI